MQLLVIIKVKNLKLYFNYSEVAYGLPKNKE